MYAEEIQSVNLYNHDRLFSELLILVVRSHFFVIILQVKIPNFRHVSLWGFTHVSQNIGAYVTMLTSFVVLFFSHSFPNFQRIN